MLCVMRLEYGNYVFICSVDFATAFDEVNWVERMEILKSIGVDLGGKDEEQHYI